MSKFEEINEETAMPVSANVSPQLHPDMLNEPGHVLATDATPLTSAAYKSARLAQQALYSTLGLIETAHRTASEQFASKVVVNGKAIVTEMDDAHKAALAADMGQAFDKVARQFDSHLAGVREVQGKLETAIAKALTPIKSDALTAQAASDLRKVVAAQPDKMGYLHQALDDKDLETVLAVLQTSPRASGLSIDQHATLRSMAAETFCPTETAQLAAVSKTIDTLKRSGEVFTSRYSKLLPVIKQSPAHKAREALKQGAGDVAR